MEMPEREACAGAGEAEWERGEGVVIVSGGGRFGGVGWIDGGGGCDGGGGGICGGCSLFAVRAPEDVGAGGGGVEAAAGEGEGRKEKMKNSNETYLWGTLRPLYRERGALVVVLATESGVETLIDTRDIRVSSYHNCRPYLHLIDDEDVDYVNEYIAHEVEEGRHDKIFEVAPSAKKITRKLRDILIKYYYSGAYPLGATTMIRYFKWSKE